MTLVRIRRVAGYPGPDLVIEDAQQIAKVFFKEDRSRDFGVAVEHPDRVTEKDIQGVNSHMGARSSHKVWVDLTEAGPLSWLQAIDPSWDLIELEDEVWQAKARDAAKVALQHTIHTGRGRAVATKVLYMKRPHLFPILDSLVLQQLGAPAEGGPQAAILLMDHLRLEGQRNLDELREVQAVLEGEFGLRSLIRILDVLIWSTHPAASIAPSLASWVRTFAM